MGMSYTLTQAEFTTLKSKLTRVLKSKNNDAIIAECNRAMAIFEQKGYPDNWSNWERAKDDATFAKSRESRRPW
jgi:hypothetical protein